MGKIKKILFNIQKIFSEPETKRYYNCLYCGKKLIGKQRKFCSPVCNGYYYRHKKLSKKQKIGKEITDYDRVFTKKQQKDRLLANKKYPSLKGILCEICGKQSTDRHHSDYDKPLEVIFLCRSCHSKIHNNKIRENNKLMIFDGENKKPFLCLYCGKELNGTRKRFCSNRCYTLYNNMVKVMKSKKIKTKYYDSFNHLNRVKFKFNRFERRLK